MAVRKDGTLSYLLADHLGSSSISTDAAGTRTSELRYKPWGESRFSYGTLPTKYTFTGQYSYMDDPSTPGSEGFGLMYYNARWYDPSLGRFAQADSIVPTSTQGTQAWDRYAYVNGNPVKYRDPSGHMMTGDGPTRFQFNNPCRDTATYTCPTPPPDDDGGSAGDGGGDNGDGSNGTGGGKSQPPSGLPNININISTPKPICIPLWVVKYCVSQNFSASSTGSVVTVNNGGFSLSNGSTTTSFENGSTTISTQTDLTGPSGQTGSISIGSELVDWTIKAFAEGSYSATTSGVNVSGGMKITSETHYDRAIAVFAIIGIAAYGAVRAVSSGDTSVFNQIPQYVH